MKIRRNHFMQKRSSKLKQLFVLVMGGIIVIFLLAGLLTSVDQQYRMTSKYVHEWAGEIQVEHFVHLLALENHYFKKMLSPDYKSLKLSTILFQVATSINPEDPRSLLGRELPGFALFDGRIIVAGDGTDYTNLPIESAPPMEVLIAEREAKKESLAKMAELEKEREEMAKSANEKKVVYIIHSHNYESFLPELETTNANEAHHSKVNITLVGEKLAQELEKRGIGAHVEQRDVQGLLKEKGWSYPRSYDASRDLIKEVMAEQQQLEFFFDLHRDSIAREKTTVTINGEDYAKTVFIVGGNHANYEENTYLAKQLHERIEKKYPGLSRGVIVKEGALTNGKFNQDLSKNALLIEIGGVENTITEAERTATALAEVFANYYFNAEEVQASKGEK